MNLGDSVSCFLVSFPDESAHKRSSFGSFSFDVTAQFSWFSVQAANHDKTVAKETACLMTESKPE